MRDFDILHKLLWGALFLGILATGCRMGKDYQKVTVETPDAFRFGSAEADTIVNLKWWEMFDDPVLDSLVRLALDNNRDLRAAALNVEQAGFALAIQKKEMYPKFNVSGQLQYGNNVGIQLESPASNFLIGTTVNWELDFWGKFRRLAESAQADFLATSYGLRALQIDMIAQVSSTYFQLLEYRNSLRISRATLALRDSTVNLIQHRYDKGIVPEIDLNQAQIQYAIAASSIPLYQRLIGQTENALSILVGVNPGPILRGKALEDQTLPPDIPIGLPSQLLSRRPDIFLAEQNIIGQNALVGVAQANRLPAISLTGLLGAASKELNSFTLAGAYNIGGSLLGPIFHWGQNKRRVDIEQSRTNQTVLYYEQTVLEAFAEVENALIEIRTLKDEVEARKFHVKAALNAQRLSEQRYDRGVTSYLEYLESQRQAFEAQLFLAQVRQQLLTAYVKLYKALGGGWLSEEEMEAARVAAEQKAQDGE